MKNVWIRQLKSACMVLIVQGVDMPMKKHSYPKTIFGGAVCFLQRFTSLNFTGSMLKP
jgi:hypothetical protein